MSPCVFCNQPVSVNLKTDPMQNSDALQFTEIKMYSYYRKAQQRQKERDKPVSGTRDAEVTKSLL